MRTLLLALILSAPILPAFACNEAELDQKIAVVQGLIAQHSNDGANYRAGSTEYTRWQEETSQLNQQLQGLQGEKAACTQANGVQPIQQEPEEE